MSSPGDFPARPFSPHLPETALQHAGLLRPVPCPGLLYGLNPPALGLICCPVSTLSDSSVPRAPQAVRASFPVWVLFLFLSLTLALICRIQLRHHALFSGLPQSELSLGYLWSLGVCCDHTSYSALFYSQGLAQCPFETQWGINE